MTMVRQKSWGITYRSPFRGRGFRTIWSD